MSLLVPFVLTLQGTREDINISLPLNSPTVDQPTKSLKELERKKENREKRKIRLKKKDRLKEKRDGIELKKNVSVNVSKLT